MRSKTLIVLTFVASLALSGTARAAAPVPLGNADIFAVLAGTTVTNTGPTVVNGDLGVSPGTAITGFPPGVVIGTMHSADVAAANAQVDLTTAYNNAAGQAVTATIGTELGGSTLPPGVYDSAAGDFGITGTLTLDGQGDPNAIFIFKTASTLVTAADNSAVNLIGGAQSCNVFWQVGSSATLGTNTLFAGNILALTAITATTGAVVNGRLLARNAAVTLDSNSISRATCDEAGPTIRITKVPTRCTAKNFKITVRVSDPIGIGRTDVFLDGKRIKRSSKTRFTVKIPAASLAPGRHKIRAVATDESANSRTARANFQRCGSAAPSFTG
jgi:hypothetical protein